MKTVCGIADAHGIESFRDKTTVSKDELVVLELRAGLNRQRHACYYESEVSDKLFTEINDLLDSNEPHRFKYALNTLKERADRISVIAGQEHSWSIIPNSDLDSDF